MKLSHRLNAHQTSSGTPLSFHEFATPGLCPWRLPVDVLCVAPPVSRAARSRGSRSGSPLCAEHALTRTERRNDLCAWLLCFFCAPTYGPAAYAYHAHM